MSQKYKVPVVAGAASALVAVAITVVALKHKPDLMPADGVLVNGMSYHGELHNGMLQGKAVLTHPTGERFEGWFVDGKLHGEGTYIDATGGKYSGEFLDGLFHGNGKYTHHDGSEYVGEFRQGLISGQGRFQYHNGDIYEGEFRRGLMHGKGAFTYSENMLFEGTFEDNLFKRGVATHSGFVFKGEFSDWRLHGEGEFTNLDGSITRGHFNEGIITGSGTQTTAEGDYYEGEFLQGMKHGHGTLTMTNGDVYTGQFEYDNYSGYGELVFASPRNGEASISGNWSWGSIDDDPRQPSYDVSENVEQLLYTQDQLLLDQLEVIRDSDTDTANLYVLGVAGYGSQDVFLKEINYLSRYIGADNRMVSLVNNHQTIGQYPVATATSFAEALGGIEQKMDVDNDILFVYMTSHGSSDHKFSIEMDGLSLPHLKPEQISSALDSTKIKWKVLVISACYSGGFIDDLEDDNTLVITASRHDRKSFGCSDESEMTYFGRAYLQHALPETASFVQAFSKAKELVASWEARDFPDSDRSLPQISLGDAIKQKLDTWEGPFDSFDVSDFEGY